MNQESVTLHVEIEQEGIRLDRFLAEKFPDKSRSYFQNLVDLGRIFINDRPAKKSEKLKCGDVISFSFERAPKLELEPEEIPLDILYEDEWLLAINKPKGLVVHPGAGNLTGTVVNAILHHVKNLIKYDDLRPGIVHRLDKDTSGVLLIAKNEDVHRALSLLFSERKVKKTYVAICVGNAPEKMSIDMPIGRHPTERKKMAHSPLGKSAITHIKRLKTNGKLSFIEIDLETGRTHQIRVHMKEIGCPILGDEIYGRKEVNQKYGVKHQMLHAKEIIFCHPKTKETLHIVAPLPDDMQSMLNRF